MHLDGRTWVTLVCHVVPYTPAKHRYAPQIISRIEHLAKQQQQKKAVRDALFTPIAMWPPYEIAVAVVVVAK